MTKAPVKAPFVPCSSDMENAPAAHSRLSDRNPIVVAVLLM
jgi:hypothetical protein